MVYCAVCGVRLTFCPPDVFACPTGHYMLRVSMSEGERLSYTSRYIQENEIARTDVPRAFQEAFHDVGVLEP